MAKVIKEKEQPLRYDSARILEIISQEETLHRSKKRTKTDKFQERAKLVYTLVLGIGITILIVGLFLIPNPSGHDSRGDSNLGYISSICFPIGLWIAIIIILTWSGYHGSQEAWERRKKRRPLILKTYVAILIFFFVWSGLHYFYLEFGMTDLFSIGIMIFGLPVTLVCLAIYLLLYQMCWWKMEGGKKTKGRKS